jgi:serine phosphatase RsbU (regulator of sigma subunit)
VERIVEVVPEPIRTALAGLAAVALGLLAAAGAAALRLRTAERRRRLLVADVGVLQSALLPTLPARFGDVEISAAYRPAEGPAAGGDFFDAFAMADGRIGVLVGDVTGHGRDAVPLTASVRYTVRAYLEAGLEPRHALHVAGSVLSDQLGGRMVTVVAAVFDPEQNTLTFSCAGHPQPILVGSDEAPVLVAASPPLGAGSATGRRQTMLALAPGSAVCLHTDGLVDLRRSGARLGFDGLARELRDLVPGRSAEQVLLALTEGARRPDDLALCVLRVPESAPANPAPRVEELELDGSEHDDRAARFLTACGIGEAEARAAMAALDTPGAAVLRISDGEVTVLPSPAVTVALV